LVIDVIDQVDEDMEECPSQHSCMMGRSYGEKYTDITFISQQDSAVGKQQEFTQFSNTGRLSPE
jgi:hypothetical protein